MTTDQYKKIRRDMKEYFAALAAINPSTAPLMWSEAIDEMLRDLPIDLEDQAVWNAILLGWYLNDFVDEAALNEHLQTTSPQHRRQVQKVVTESLMEVYRTSMLIPSMNVRKALPIAIARDLTKFAMQETTEIESSVEALRFLKGVAKSQDLRVIIQNALDEAKVSRHTDHFPHFFNQSSLGASNLGYGIFIGMEAPSDASELFSSVELPSLRDFRISAIEGGEN